MKVEELQDQIIDLQARIAHQEDTLRELDTVATAQAKRIERLEARVSRFAERLDSALTAADDAPVEEPPPHY